MKLKNIIFLITCFEVSLHSMEKSCGSTGSAEDLARTLTVPKLQLAQNDSNQDAQNDSIAVSLRRTCSDREIVMMREGSKRDSSLFAPLDYTDKEVRELSKNLEGSVRKLPKALREKDHLLSDNDDHVGHGITLDLGDEKTEEDVMFESLVRDHADNSEGNKHFALLLYTIDLYKRHKATMSAYVENVNVDLKDYCKDTSSPLIQLLSSSDDDE